MSVPLRVDAGAPIMETPPAASLPCALFLLFRRVAHCRVDLFQFVDEVAATEAVVGDRADLGLGEALGRAGASG